MAWSVFSGTLVGCWFCLRLAVGCGFKGIGDVNSDIDFKPVRGFVRCSGLFLPFRGKVFSEVVSIHVLEHVVNPELFIKECMRVCCGRVKLVVPHRFSRWAKKPFHLHYFNMKSFLNMGVACDVRHIVRFPFFGEVEVVIYC